ncbi:MAG: hypothetical protein ACOH13_15370 [Flavobacteriales bacterium]
MEPTERYDPEDLEHLMLERRFDELLEEERTFALRHLTGRAEYERMRALLLHVREERTEQGTLDAPPKVREHVLRAFREQQRPQWKIWLNSVGGFLLPERPAQYWRPALALGTVAVLVFASLFTWRTMGTDGNKVLAEVKEVKKVAAGENTVAPAPAVATANAQADTDRTSVGGNATQREDALTERSTSSEQNMTENGTNIFAEVADSAPNGIDGSLAGLSQRSIAAVQQNDPTKAKEGARAKSMEKEHTQSASSTLLQNAASADELREDVAAKPTRLEEGVHEPASTRAAGSSKAYADKDTLKRSEAEASPTEDELLGLLRAAW